ncbi:hypothetical protein ACFCX6_22010 [Streptomyces sp. NPDC056353]|uniref:hypothetical protein n=1 Tax=unclassified Streptomyces TaxID=2593676 RepID=UPI0035D9FEDA
MRIGFGDDCLQRLVMYVAFVLDARLALTWSRARPRQQALLWRGPSSALIALLYDAF